MGRGGWIGIVAYLQEMFDGSPFALILALIAGLVVIRVLLAVLSGHGLPIAHVHRVAR